MRSGRVVFGEMDEVVFGKPAAEAVAEQASRLGATRVFLMVIGTLNRETDEIEKLRRALGNKCVGVFDAMPPHTPRITPSCRKAHLALLHSSTSHTINIAASFCQA